MSTTEQVLLPWRRNPQVIGKSNPGSQLAMIDYAGNGGPYKLWPDPTPFRMERDDQEPQAVFGVNRIFHPDLWNPPLRYIDTPLTLAQFPDGTSNTLLVGEKPVS